MMYTTSKRFDELKSTGLLPSPTGVAMEILRLTQCDSSTTEQMGITIQADPTLAGRVLKYANSSYAGGRDPVVAITEAIVRLGTRTVGELVLGFSLLSSSHKGCCANFDYERFWSKSLILAVATKALCKLTKVVPENEGFTCGLLSQIGRLALASVYPDQYAGILSSWNADEEELKCIEERVFLTNHDELTAAMMKDWGLPPLFYNAIMFKSSHGNSPSDERSREEHLSLTLSTADRFAELWLSDAGKLQYLYQEMIRCYESLGLESSGLGKLSQEVAEESKCWADMLCLNVRTVPEFREVLEQSTLQGRQASTQAPNELECDAELEPTSLHVMVVEDDPVQLRSISKQVTDAGHRVTIAVDGKEALHLALETNPDVVITDWIMPEMDGLELCRSLRQERFGRELYLIIVTSNEEEEYLVEAFEAGADDYLVKPLLPRPLLARIRAATRIIDLQREVQQERKQIRHMTAELAVANRKLEEAALTDALTGLHNRRYFSKRFKQEWAALSRQGGSLACMLLDIDRFKNINDTFGHDVGDSVLKEVATTLQNAMRETDILCRYGGEEFIVLCTNTDHKGAARGAERLRKIIANRMRRGAFEQFENSITVSIGVASYNNEMQNKDQLIKAADQGLYKAKELGRNQIYCIDEMTLAETSMLK